MEWFVIGLLLFVVWGAISNHRSISALSAKVTTPVSAAEQPAIAGPVQGHKLVRVWDNRSCDHDRQGWWFECSCGMTRPSSKTNSKAYGSEYAAVETYKSHATLHKGLAGEDRNPLEDKLNKVTADFDKYRKTCYCKDANDDLRLMDFEYSLTTEPVEE